MNEIEFEGISSGNGGTFFWEVDKETYIAVMGEESFGLADSVSTLRICAESLFDALKIKNHFGKKMKIKFSAEIIDEKIDDFRGDYFFLSNFCPSPFVFPDIKYETVEHAFQALKATNQKDHDLVKNSKNPSEAKRYGRRIKLRDDWEEVKDDYMYCLVKAKFSQNPGQAKMLIETGNAELIEGNTWGDTHFGVCSKTSIGENVLGKILMRVREELKNEENSI